ncbi:MAG: cytochrome c-type biogenesis protein CcmH [Chloroflexota bacterium]|nr:MAG: cytochrome c-type biogenesis protein CcmH [Chloroflexota bacterium]
MKPNSRSVPIFVFLLVLIAIVASLASVSTVFAQEVPASGPTDDEVNAVAKQLYCPVCENIPLDVCPTQACAQWRELIREKLAEGWTEDQIKTYFVNQYGDRVLAAPPARGLNWLVYIIPPLVLIAGIYILYRALKSWRQASPILAQESQPAEEPGDEYVARIEDELRRR